MVEKQTTSFYRPFRYPPSLKLWPLFAYLFFPKTDMLSPSLNDALTANDDFETPHLHVVRDIMSELIRDVAK